MFQSRLKIYREDEAPRTRELDLLNEDITVDFLINDISNIVQSRSPFVKNLRLLGTNRTNKALEWIFRLDTVSENIKGKAIPAILEVGDETGVVDVLQGGGVLTITDIDYDPISGLPVYSCLLTAGRFKWASLMRDLKVKDLPNLGTHTYNETIVLNSLDRTGYFGTVRDENYIGCSYFPVFYGSWKPGASRISFYDLRPHIYIKYLLEKACEHLGYTLTGDYVNSEDFRQMVMIYGRGSFVASADEINAATCEVFHSNTPICYEATGFNLGDGIFLTLENCGAWNGFQWTQPGEIGLEMEIEFNIDPGLPNNSIAFQIISNDGTTDTILDQQDYNIGSGNTSISRVCLLPGHTVRLRWVYHSTQNPVTCPACFPAGSGCGGSGSNPNITLGLLSASMKFTPAAIVDGAEPGSPLIERCIGSTVDLAKTVDPDITVKDVIDGITHLRALFWETNEVTKTITPTPVSDYIQGFDTVNWTKKLDIGTGLEKNLNPDCPNFLFGYKDTNDEWYGQELWNNKLFNGLGLYSMESIETPFNACLKENKNPVFATLYQIGLERDYDVDQSNVPPFRALYLSLIKDAYQYPLTTDPENFISYDFAPRIAKYEGFRQNSDIGWTQSLAQWKYLTSLGVNFTYSVFPYAYVVDYYQLTRRSLSYTDITRNTVSPTGAGGPQTTNLGIVNAEYELLYDVLKRGISFKCSMFLTPKDIFELDFSKFIKLEVPGIGQGLFFLSKITGWNPVNGLAKVELFQLPEGYPT